MKISWCLDTDCLKGFTFPLFPVKCGALKGETHQLCRRPEAPSCVVHSVKGEDSRGLTPRAIKPQAPQAGPSGQGWWPFVANQNYVNSKGEVSPISAEFYKSRECATHRGLKHWLWECHMSFSLTVDP